jgi:hypothetical protein
MESKAFLRFVSLFVFHLLGVQLTVLWLVVLLLAVAVTFIFLQNKRRRRATKPNGNGGPTEQEDMEAHQQTTTTNDDEALNSSRRIFSYGAATAIPVFSAITAFGLSVYPHTSCEFVGFSGYEHDSGGLSSIGLWSVAYRGTSSSDFGGEGNCYSSFPLNFDPDAALTLARVSAIAATVVGGACMLILLYFSVVTEQQTSRLRSSLMVQWLAVSFCVAAFFQGLSLSVLGTDSCNTASGFYCTVDFGAVSTMTALLYWLVAAMGVFLLPLKEA